MDPTTPQTETPREETTPEEPPASRSRRAFLRTAALTGVGAVVAGALPGAVAAAATATPVAGTAPLGADAFAPVEPGLASTTGVALIDTVLGPVKPSSVGKVLAHEHLYVDFQLFNSLTDPNYLKPVGGFDKAIDVISKYVLEVKAQGVELIIDWGCMGVGRSPNTARDVAKRTGVNVAIPTGIYKWLLEPKFDGWSVDKLSRYMVKEFRQGIYGTDIKPAFIKLGANPVPTKIETNIHHAATQAAAEVGATVACHLPFPLDARNETELARARQVWGIARSNGVKPDRFVWGHANGVIKADKVTPAHLDSARSQYLELMSEGATLQFDSVGADPKNAADPWFGGPTDPAVFLDLLESFVDLGYGDRVMISNDASVYVNPGGGQGGELVDDYAAAGQPNWQYPRDIRYLYGTFEALMIARIGAAATTQILSKTPARVFSRVRSA